MTNTNVPATFYGLGIAPKVLEALERMKFKVPTPIQHKAIPLAVEGKDIMGIAQTGTGKTLAFAVPMVQRLAQGAGNGLVVVPTRELAIQVEETVEKVAVPFGIKTAVLIGGASMEEQIRASSAARASSLPRRGASSTTCSGGPFASIRRASWSSMKRTACSTWASRRRSSRSCSRCPRTARPCFFRRPCRGTSWPWPRAT